MSRPDLIIHDEKDNVGVVVIETTKKGQDCSAWIMENDKTVKVPSTNDVPLGHKIALKDLKIGDTIFKYGHDIGKVVQEIKKGEHVHVHNVKTIILPLFCFYIVNMNVFTFFDFFDHFSNIVPVFKNCVPNFKVFKCNFVS